MSATPAHALIAETLGAPVATLTALQAAHRIIALHDVACAVFTAVHRQVMQAAWVIRHEHPEREGFDRFCAAHGLDNVMPSERVWLAAETWEVMRRQRGVRELAERRPDEAIQFVAEFVSRGAAQKLERLGENHPRVVEICALPAKERTSEIHRLIGIEQAVSEGRHPADVEQIRTLAEERDAALQELERRREVLSPNDTPAGHVRMLHREASELLGNLSDLAGTFEALLERAPTVRSKALEGAVHAMTLLGDDIVDLGERIGAAALGETD